MSSAPGRPFRFSPQPYFCFSLFVFRFFFTISCLSVNLSGRSDLPVDDGGCVDERSATPELEQRRICNDQRGHGLDDGDRAWNDAWIVPPAGLEHRLSAAILAGRLSTADGRRRFECDLFSSIPDERKEESHQRESGSTSIATKKVKDGKKRNRKSKDGTKTKKVWEKKERYRKDDGLAVGDAALDAAAAVCRCTEPPGAVAVDLDDKGIIVLAAAHPST